MQANSTSGPSLANAIGIIIGSTRPACNGRPIASWVHKTVLQHSASSSSNSCSYELVDLSQWNLPLFDEPGVPARNAPVHEHTKAWQAKVKTLDGFVFVSPQVSHMCTRAQPCSFTLESFLVGSKILLHACCQLVLGQQHVNLAEDALLLHNLE